jgi:formate C-acetyltransferase
MDPSFSINRIRIETKVMRQTEREPMVLRRARVFAAVAQQLPIEIWPGELIVGHASSRPLCLDIVPADCPLLLAGRRFASVTETVEYGLKDFSDDDQKEMIEEIFPYWRDGGNWEKTHTGLNFSTMPDNLKSLIYVDQSVYPPRRSMIYTSAGDTGHYGHNSADYEGVLNKGLLGIKTQAQARLESLNEEDKRATAFLQAVVECIDAAVKAGARFASVARKAALDETDPARRAELMAIAEICERVPAHPARTFHEALQSIYSVQVFLNWESPRAVSQTAGRIDRYLYPYLVRGLDEGRLTRDQAQELLDCYILKLNHVNRGNHIAVGGYGADGRDATNDLSYMLIESMKRLRFNEPYFSILLHPRTPDALLIKAAELSAMGTGHPVYLNADVLTTQMLGRGTAGGPPITLPLARLATPVGCYEPVIAGMDSGYFHGGFFNMAAVMELVLTNGYSRFYKRQIGPETGDPRSFNSFEDFRDAYVKQFQFMMKNFSEASNLNERIYAELLPTPFESSLIHDCIAQGKSREDGGARYNFKSIVGAGSTDVGDSLAAIKKLVYQERKISMAQLCNVLDADFEGMESLRTLLQEAPKFGNDDDYADEQAAWVSHIFAMETAKQPNTRGGHTIPLGAPLQYYLVGGQKVGALPSGRKAWEPLSDAWSPCAGCDVSGPTAIVGSMAKIDHAELSGGVTLNIRLDPDIFKSRDGFDRFIQFLRAFVDHGIFQVQFNIISTETLLQAQKEPEKYKDLTVKVAGYSAYFTRLMKPLQDGIIARTVHKL